MIGGGPYSIPYNMKIYINIVTIISYNIIAHIHIFIKKESPYIKASRIKLQYSIVNINS